MHVVSIILILHAWWFVFCSLLLLCTFSTWKKNIRTFVAVFFFHNGNEIRGKNICISCTQRIQYSFTHIHTICASQIKEKRHNIDVHVSFIHKKISNIHKKNKKKWSCGKKSATFFSLRSTMYIRKHEAFSTYETSLSLPFQCCHNVLGSALGYLSLSSSSSNVGISRSKHRAHWILERGGVET